MSTPNKPTPKGKPVQSPNPSTDIHTQQEKQDVLIAEASMGRYEALRAINFIANSDFLLLGLIGLCLMTLIFWHIFADPTFAQAASCVIAIMFLTQLWMLSLIYRCMHYIITLQTTVNVMPEAAAKIVMAAFGGGRK